MPVVRDWAPLDLDYVPPRLLHRDGELRRIRDALARASRAPKGGMVVEGFTGTGKTAAVRYTLRALGPGGARVVYLDLRRALLCRKERKIAPFSRGEFSV
ncbi:MAG: hypothetical protein QI223_02085 [Candidatus Korarchaeota archaeon]|nr:hypothetical protein [Candidatus Korarchaeota archaeon]